MKLSQLGFFCAVVEHGTIAAAAVQLHCVPSNITTRLRELENQLGVVLFNREKNRLLVTPEGRLVYRNAKLLVDLAAETRSLFSTDSINGVLRVGALDVALANHLPQRLVRYRLVNRPGFRRRSVTAVGPECVKTLSYQGHLSPGQIKGVH